MKTNRLNSFIKSLSAIAKSPKEKYPRRPGDRKAKVGRKQRLARDSRYICQRRAKTKGGD
ncbi:hypothetical protein DPMN_063971 [Dreissena polymorpha]|uniref:Uncharacterized protein n=1 Tax=Dreissena polymorpha TaxID=45954 RepID=A0A9D4HLP2_DREPO|nr:hypothetical protein DPMN_063971 [Dreissena polymorpha]